MSGTHTITMGDRGRLVIPFEVRNRTGLTEGRPLILLETEDGLVVLTREQLKTRIRRDLSGSSLVDELLEDRRAEVAAEADAE